MKHRLELRDRGLEHVHRWQPSCPCGWTAVPVRRRDDAEDRYRQHLPKPRRRWYVPRRPTRTADLPEELR